LPSLLNTNVTVKQVTRLINGGENGLPHRQSLFNQVKNHIQCK